MIALITQGKSNMEIAALMYLSINTVKTYVRTAYRKIGVDHPPTRHLCGASTTASRPTTTASNTGAAGPDVLVP